VVAAPGRSLGADEVVRRWRPAALGNRPRGDVRPGARPHAVPCGQARGGHMRRAVPAGASFRGVARRRSGASRSRDTPAAGRSVRGALRPVPSSGRPARPPWHGLSYAQLWLSLGGGPAAGGEHAKRRHPL